MITDYASLVAAVASHTVRDDLDAEMPRFVQMSEALMKRRLRTMDTERTVTVTVAAGLLALPADCLSVKAVSDVAGDVAARYDFPGPDVRSYFERRGDALLLTPALDDGAVVRVTYQAAFEPLADGTTNWLIEDHPDVYFYGILAQAYAWLRDPEAGSYAGLFDGVLDDIQQSRTRDKYGSAPLIPRGIRQVAGVRT